MGDLDILYWNSKIVWMADQLNIQDLFIINKIQKVI